MALTMVFTYMPAMAFAYDGAGTDRGNPKSIEYIHTGTIEAQGWLCAEDDEGPEYVQFFEPGFEEGDILKVTYQNNDTVRYVAETHKASYGEYIVFVSTSDSSDVLEYIDDVWTEWVNEQSYDHQFTEGSYEKFRICIGYYDENEDPVPLASTTATAHLVIGEETDKGWSVGYDDAALLENGKALLEVDATSYDGATRSFTYKWSKWNDAEEDYVIIPKATDRSYEANAVGYYQCAVTSSDGGEDSAEIIVRTWLADAAGDTEFEIVQNGAATLEVAIEGVEPDDMTYEWYTSNEYSEEIDRIQGEAGKSLRVTSGGYYVCKVYEGTDEEDYDLVLFNVEKADRKWNATPVDDTVVLNAGQNAKLELLLTSAPSSLTYQWQQFAGYDEQGEEIYENIRGANRSYYVTSETGQYKCLISDGTQTISREFWVVAESVYENGIEYTHMGDHVAVRADLDNEPSGVVTIPQSIKLSDGKAYPVQEIEYFAYNAKLTGVIIPSSVTYISDEAFISTGLKSVTIPASVKHIGENAFGYNWEDAGAEEGQRLARVAGFVIYGKIGSEAQRYAKANGFKFVDRDAEAKAKAAAEAKARADAAARAKAAEYAANGNAYIDPTLPKVKIKGPKKAKKSFTAKWKKLNKKQLKKVKGIEIEYSLTPDFKNPVFKTVGKKKANVKVKKLKSKKTYYVRAHTFVFRGGQKYVSNWSAAKKVKVK